MDKLDLCTYNYIPKSLHELSTAMLILLHHLVSVHNPSTIIQMGQLRSLVSPHPVHEPPYCRKKEDANQDHTVVVHRRYSGWVDVGCAEGKR